MCCEQDTSDIKTSSLEISNCLNSVLVKSLASLKFSSPMLAEASRTIAKSIFLAHLSRVAVKSYIYVMSKEIKTSSKSVGVLQVLLSDLFCRFLWDLTEIPNSRQNCSKNRMVCKNAVTRVSITSNYHGYKALKKCTKKTLSKRHLISFNRLLIN